MKKCTFELNGQAMSNLTIGALSFPAFSGLGDNINRRISACVPNLGPIPPGDYFILNRESGGGFYPALTDTSQPDKVSNSISLLACPPCTYPAFPTPFPELRITNTPSTSAHTNRPQSNPGPKAAASPN